VELIELNGVTVVILSDCQANLTLCDVAVLTGSFTVIATDVTILRAFAIAPSFAQPVGAFLLWDALGNGLPNGGAILIDRNRDGDFGESREIRVFGKN
jgi:hypothetical protein